MHYSATIYRWYKNWLSNKDKVIAKYGERWYRIWVYFLAYSIIVARYMIHFPVSAVFIIPNVVDLSSQGGSAAFQITLHKNLNAYHRIEGVRNHASIKVTPRNKIS